VIDEVATTQCFEQNLLVSNVPPHKLDSRVQILRYLTTGMDRFLKRIKNAHIVPIK
jgi:hypothetical protein